MAAKKKTGKGARRKKLAPKRKPAKRPARKAATKKRPARRPAHLTPVPESPDEVVLWFQTLAGRVDRATDDDLRALIAEAQKFDLVGLSEALGREDDVLALNRAANTLLEAAIDASPAVSQRAHLLAVLRDILNDS